MSGAPRGSVLGPALLKVFVGGMHSGIQCTLSKFDMAPGCAVQFTHRRKGKSSRQTSTSLKSESVRTL